MDWQVVCMRAEDEWQVHLMLGRGYHGIDDAFSYMRERDKFKAERILELYGYEYFKRFVDCCPHIADIFTDLSLCERQGRQCSCFCDFYKEGRCVLYATA